MLDTHLFPLLWGRIEVWLPCGREAVGERWIFTDAFSSVVLTTRPTLQNLLEFLEWFDPERSHLLLTRQKEAQVDVYAPFQLIVLAVVDQLVRWDNEDKANQFIGRLIDLSGLLLTLYHLNPQAIPPQTIFNVLKFLELAYEVRILDVAMLRKELTNIKKGGGVPEERLAWYDFATNRSRQDSLPELLQSLISLAFGRG